MSFPLSVVLIASLSHIGKIALLLLGFGFVIFWHELGHFLAAKFVGIRVEQFAVGFGNALFAWRKGVGLRFGNTQKDYREKAEQHLAARRTGNDQPSEKIEYTDDQIAAAGDELGLGQTEYRLNWIPLGGYVKMLGQDDLKPDAVADNPQAYNKKSIPARMLVISAGVIMNVILAAIGFMILFGFGFHVAPAWVGNVQNNSPAQRATLVKGLPTDTPGLQPGDRLYTFDGDRMQDFTKITLATALAKDDEPVLMEVDRPDTPEAKSFHRITLSVTPARRENDPSLLAIGFEQPHLLQGLLPIEGTEAQFNEQKGEKLSPEGAFAVAPGDTITAVNGQKVKPTDYLLFDHIVQNSFGNPITLTIRNAAGKEHDAPNNLHFATTFNSSLNIAGMIPRVQIGYFSKASVCRGDGQLKLGDVILNIKSVDDLPHPTFEQLVEGLTKAGTQKGPIDIKVLRDGKEMTVSGLHATIKYSDPKGDRYGIGMGPGYDEKEAVIAGLTDDGSAKKAGLQAGDRIMTVDGQPVQNWFDVQRVIAQWNPKSADGGIPVTYKRDAVAEVKNATLSFTPEQLASVRSLRYQADVQDLGTLAEYIVPRKADGVGQAAHWGVTETRDFILQFYVTLRRMAGGQIPASSMMGPLGIAYTGSVLAFKGYDWLLWFLCMISANLAVVNFLPIPVVDGGQFVFLIMEKIKGEPISMRAMVIAQYIGLSFLGALVLYVTYHDIMRMVFG